MAAVATPVMAPNGNGAASPTPAAANGDGKEKENYLEGMIYPPPDIRSIVDKTASFIAKHANPAAFEDKIRQREKTDSKFSFLNDSDAYHAYYQHRIKQFKDGTAGPLAGAGAAPGVPGTGGADALTASRAIAGAAGEMVDEGRPTVPRPRPFEFINTEKPPMAPVDADILRLTALFTARMGRGFTSDLSARESGNYQFDFLRPSHSLFGYFNRLVEQYTKVLMAPKESVDLLERQSGHTEEYDALLTTEEKRRAIGRREIMQGVENRVEWQKYDNARRQAEDTAAEEERIAFATIDWQDFIVVSTVDFTDQDELLDLPPPMSRSEVENMTLAQKRMAAMIMEGKDVATAAVESGAVSKEADDAEMEMSGDEADELTKRVVETSKAPQEAKLAVGANGPIKIRKDYVPKSQRAKKVVTTACRVCGQQIPESEMAEHVRIELLDPRWKEKQMEADSKRSASNMLLAGTDVASSLRQIAAKRTDIFSATQEDEARRRAKEEEERIRKREREKVVWDGHTASAISTAERFQTGANLDEQIAALHRAKGLTAMESNIGPKMGAAPGGTDGQASGPAPNFFSAPGSFSGATLSAAANPQAQSQQPDPMQMQQQQQQQQQQQYQYNAYPQQGYPGYPQQQQYGYDPNQQYQQQQLQQQQQYQAGQARPAEQSEEANKRQKQ